MTATMTPQHDLTMHTDIDQEGKLNLLTAQAQRIVTLQAEIEERQTKIDKLKQQILDTHEPGSYEAGDLQVQVREGSKRLNASRFKKTYPAEQYPELYKIAPDSTTARKKLGEDALTGLFDQGKSTVVIK